MIIILGYDQAEVEHVNVRRCRFSLNKEMSLYTKQFFFCLYGGLCM